MTNISPHIYKSIIQEVDSEAEYLSPSQAGGGGS